MAHSITEATPADDALPVRTITADDLDASLRDGWADFKALRGDLLLVGLLYPAIGIVTAAFITESQLMLLFPLFAGLSLMGPVAAVGFYELARRREEGLDSRWRHFFDGFRGRQGVSIAGLGLLAIFVAWLASAALVYALFLGPEPPATIFSLFRALFTTPEGWATIIVGNLVGLLFALLVLATSVVSMPMLVDRRISAERAIAISLAAFRRNPVVMLRWGLMVAAILVIGAIPLLIGLAAALPVLGYATWHLYTRLVDRSALPTEVQ